MKYDAFISYRHAELDQFVAENLHKKLEAFRLPKSIVKQRGKDCKKKIERVFRDRDELPLATNLADPITDALENSEFLIVICSPRLPQSLWCKKEIETFISMHGREHVLAVLIEGEPDESFPEELLYRTREITKEDGTVEVIKEPVEPLAADVRGKTKKEVLKKMDEELLRLAAAMFECAYDDLKQRHKEQKMKKMLTASLAASAFFLVFGAVSTTMAIRIQSQKEQIQAQSVEIQAQKEEIEVQYQQALYNQSLSMAEDSLQHLEEGDRLEAMKIAIDALGKTEDGTPMPVTAEAQYALAESSYVYQDGESWIPAYMLKHDANISMMQASPDGTRLLTADQYGNIYIWDVLTNQMILQIEGDYFSSVEKESCFFINDHQIVYKGEESFEVYDIQTQEVVLEGEESFYRGTADVENGLFAVVMSDILREELQIYDAENLKLLHSIEIPENMSVDSVMAFDDEGTKFAYVLEPYSLSSEGGETILTTIDLKSGQVVGEIQLEYSSYVKLQMIDGVLYAGVHQSSEEAFPDGEFDLTTPYKSIMYAINLSDMSIKWEYRFDEAMLNDFKINAADFSRHIMLSYYSDAQMLDMDTGELLYKFAYGEEIVATFYYTTSDVFIIMVRDGEYHQIIGSNGSDVVFVGYFQANSTNIKQMMPLANGFVTLPYSDCNVTYYEMCQGPEYELWCEQDEDITEVYVNEVETRAIVVEGYGLNSRETAFLRDLNTGELIKEVFCTESTGVSYGFVGSGEEYFYVYESEKVSVYSVADGSLYAEYPLEDTIYPEYVMTSNDGKALIFRDYNDFGKINLEDGTLEYITVERDGDYSVKLNINQAFDTYAVADKEINAILLYRAGEEEPYLQIEVIAPLVDEMIFTEDNKYLIVYYMDKSAAVYDTESGACIKEYENFGDSTFSGVTSFEEGYAVSVLGGVYLLNKDFERIALLPGSVSVMPKMQKFLVIDGSAIYSCPIYTTEQLLEKSQEILKGLNAYE